MLVEKVPSTGHNNTSLKPSMECLMNKHELAAQLRVLERRQHQLLAMLRDFIDDSELIQGSTFALPPARSEAGYPPRHSLYYGDSRSRS